MPIRLYFSNDIETLAGALSQELSDRTDWFTPGTIIVPNPYLQKWLQMRIADRCCIAMNLDFRFLNEGLWKLADAINVDQEKPSMIDPLDLQLMLHKVLSMLDTGNSTVKPVTEYLHAPDGKRKTGYDHRSYQLSSRLCRYFMEYELYREDMIRGWMQGTLQYNTPMEAAQQYLYCALFKNGGLRDAVNRNLLTLPQYWARVSSQTNTPFSGKLYLFGKSQLSPFHVRLLYELGKRIDISLYQLNPCSEFWEDVTTPREDRWNRIRSIRVEENAEGKKLSYDDNENPLLKLWGKTGRETIKLLSLLEDAGSSGTGFQSEWFDPAGSAPAAGCLGAVREQILRRTTRTPSGREMRQDTSIQVASCPELFREAEAVFNSILHNLEQDPRLAMTDIAIMVPDMEAYGPVLHSVFSREPKRLSYSMIDSTAATDSLFGKGMASLLNIAAGSFTRAEIFSLAYNRCFLAAHDMTIEDADTWLSWADALQVFHGFNRNDDPDPRRNPYTWQQALQRIRMGRIMNPFEADGADGTFLNYGNIVPYANMNTADQDLVDSFSRVIELLYARTRYLSRLSATGKEWARIIEGLASDFLAIPEDRPEEAVVRQKLLADIQKLFLADTLSETGPGTLYTLAFIKEFITQTLAGIPSTHGSYLVSGINISALVPKRQVPFKIIYLVGMQEGIFPGVIDSSTLNLISHFRMIGDVTRPDANRYLFLETLLSAREKIYISFINKDLQKDKAYYPNSVIGQLITYLEANVIKKDFIITEVPPSGSSDRYLFSAPGVSSLSDFVVSCRKEQCRPVNYSETDLLLMYRNAARSISRKTMLPPVIKDAISKKIPDFTIPVPAAVVQTEAAELSLRDLANFLINPIESSLRWHLGIYEGDDDDRSIAEDEPFFTKYPYSYRFIMDALNYYIRSGAADDLTTYLHNYYEHATLMSITPDGAFRDIDYGNYRIIVSERLGAVTGLADFIRSRKNLSFYQNVTFGINRMRVKPGVLFPPLRFIVGNGSISVELSGSVPFIWKNPGTGECETLIITGSGKPAITHIIQPFLFYMAALSGQDRDLCDFIGAGPFTIHVAHTTGIAGYRCHASAHEARAYCERLAADFLDASSFDLLPLAIIADAKSALPHEMKDRLDPAEEKHYRDLLVRLIDDDAEKSRPSYRPMSILQLLDAQVPDNAYAKARDRLGPLFKPFMEGGSPS